MYVTEASIVSGYITVTSQKVVKGVEKCGVEYNKPAPSYFIANAHDLYGQYAFLSFNNMINRIYLSKATY